MHVHPCSSWRKQKLVSLTPMQSGQNADAVPPRHAHHRWRRDALLPRATGGRPLVNDTCVHTPDTTDRVASWITTGPPGSTASAQDSRGRKHRCLQRLYDINSSDGRCLLSVHDGKWWEPQWKIKFMQEVPQYWFFNLWFMAEESLSMWSHTRVVTTHYITTNHDKC